MSETEEQLAREVERKRVESLPFTQVLGEICSLLKAALFKLPRSLLLSLTDKDSAAKVASAAFVLLFFLIVSIWIGSAVVIRVIAQRDANAGQFGDMFGAVNSLFSGIALAGVIIAIVLQTFELRAQREEIQESQKIAKETSQENKNAAEQLLLTGYVNAAVALLNVPKILSADQEQQVGRIRAALLKADQNAALKIDRKVISSRKSILLKRIRELIEIAEVLEKTVLECIEKRQWRSFKDDAEKIKVQYLAIKDEIPDSRDATSQIMDSFSIFARLSTMIKFEPPGVLSMQQSTSALVDALEDAERLIESELADD